MGGPAVTPPPVKIFCFGGREENVRLQMPFIRRILQRHPNVSYDIWDLTHNVDDSKYVRSLQGERISVITKYAGLTPWRHFNDVYKYYTDPRFSDHLFVKIDDDVVFIETNRFGHFVERIQEDPDTIMSAKVINNGACTYTIPGIQACFDQLPVELLDVHMSADYALMSHAYFFERWKLLTGEAPELLPVPSWLSINLIGYDWAMGRKMANLLGTVSPREVATRHFPRNSTLGDEGMVNTLPRAIVQGFLACHLNFGPQSRGLRTALDQLRKEYKTVGDDYLAGL